MQPITVAIADDNLDSRTRCEQSLQGQHGIKVLTNTTTGGGITKDRRRNPRANIPTIEDIVARVRRLNPRILLAGLKQCTDANCAMLMALRSECPGTLVVLLVDESVQQEDQVMQALASGARGYLNPEADLFRISKAVHVIDRGEAWVPRRMLGKIMDQLLYWCNGRSIGARLDPAC